MRGKITLSILQAIILGLVQGLTEFLPISSSGHLVLAEHLLNVPPVNDITFEVFVHFGTLMSIVVVFWKDIVAIVQAVLKGFIPFRLNRQYYRENEHFRLGLAIIVGSIPAGIIGLKYEDQITGIFTDPKLVAVMLVITGLILFLTRLAKPIEGKNVGMGTSLLIGIAQAVAITPGISRSGTTISAAMYLRISPINAAKFSFLLSLPAVFGATLLKARLVMENGALPLGALPLIAGMVVAFLSGYVAIKYLLRVIERGKFSWFSLYCLVIGILGISFI